MNETAIITIGVVENNDLGIPGGLYKSIEPWWYADIAFQNYFYNFYDDSFYKELRSSTMEEF